MVVKIKRPKPLLIIIILMIVLFITTIATFVFLNSPVDRGDNTKVEVEIASNTSTLKIGEILKEKNLIKSKYLFFIYVKMNSVKSLKASTYVLNKSMGLVEIVEELEKGSNYNPNLVKITFKEEIGRAHV